VAWIAERKDVLSTFFGLASALAYVGYVRSPRAGRYALVLLLFALGLMAKPMLVTWPFVLLLLDVWPLKRFEPVMETQRGRGRRRAAPQEDTAARVRRAVLEKLPMLALSALASALTVWAQAAGGALKSTELHPLAARVPNALLAYVQYLRKTVWPTDLGVLYPFPQNFPAGEVAASAAVLAAVTVACVRLRRRHPYLLVGWLWYLGTLVPVIGIVQVGAHAYADRYTYIPLIGIFIAVVWGVGALLEDRRRLTVPAALLTLGVLALLAFTASRQVAVWQDSVSLYRHTLRVTEKNAVMHNNLGIALADRERYDEAIRVYEEGLAFPSNFVHTLSYNAGVAHTRKGQQREALALFEQALRIDPDYAEALYYKALALKELGQLDAARRALERVVELEPEEAEPHVKLGLVLGQLGRPAEAKRHFERALVLAPLDVDARINLAVAELKTGDTEAAIEQLERVLRQQPGHAGARRYLEAARARRSQGEPAR
jgi:Tfp pilus assembly protein PilF